MSYIIDSKDTLQEQVLHETLLTAAEAREKGYLDTTKWTPKQLLVLEKSTDRSTMLVAECDAFFASKLGSFVTWTGILAVWVLGGALFGLYDQGMTGPESWEFAITSISTGGLMGPKPNADGNLGVFSALFISVYCLIGVPLFGAWIGAWINLLLGESQKEEAMADALDILTAGIDDQVSEYYINRIIPVLYPLVEEGGVSTEADREERCQRVRDDNPALVDALVIAGLADGIYGSIDDAYEYIRYHCNPNPSNTDTHCEPLII